MKTISISLETLRNGNVRATGRHNGRTVAWKEGAKESAKDLLLSVMRETCPFHSSGNGLDMTHISLNEAARTALA